MAVDIQYDVGKRKSVDISEESNCTEILQNLETTGWFIVKNATSVDSNTPQSYLESNAAVRQILGLEKNLYTVGRFRKREVNMHTREPFFQSKDGKLLQPSLRIIFVIHLGTTRDEKWFFEYKPVNNQIPVELMVNGTDMYGYSYSSIGLRAYDASVFVASWMIWRLPWRADVSYSYMAEIVYVKSSP